ncbi:MAG: hypothetical protein M0P61_11365 [Ignavibacteriaceae bacterium]|jgi:hypothetical protein|nr:hypothetical protein [Ignavibacteriaceae bacterium]
MKKIIGILSVVILQGCGSELLYTTNNIPIPLVQKQGETQISGQYGTNGKSFNLVSSPLEHISLSIAGNYDKVTINSNDFDTKKEDKNSHNYTEVAIGYFDNVSESIVGEAFVGYGRGDGMDQYYQRQEFSSIVHNNFGYGKYDKYFVQANLGNKNNAITTGFAIRLSYVDFLELMKTSDGVTTFPSGKEALFFEPALFGKIGGKNLQLEVEVMFPYTQKGIDFDYRNFVISTGLRFIF